MIREKVVYSFIKEWKLVQLYRSGLIFWTFSDEEPSQICLLVAIGSHQYYVFCIHQYYVDHTEVPFSCHWIHHKLFTWTVYDFICGVTIILDHQITGVDITFPVLSSLVQDIWCKIHNIAMVESEMAFIATKRQICYGSNFYAFIKNSDWYTSQHVD